MTTFMPVEFSVGLVSDWFIDPELLATWVLLLIVLLGGGAAIFRAFHWYRNLKQAPSATGEALAQLSRALEEPEEFDPEEIERIRAAIERQKPKET